MFLRGCSPFLGALPLPCMSIKPSTIDDEIDITKHIIININEIPSTNLLDINTLVKRLIQLQKLSEDAAERRRLRDGVRRRTPSRRQRNPVPVVSHTPIPGGITPPPRRRMPSRSIVRDAVRRRTQSQRCAYGVRSRGMCFTMACAAG